MAHANQHAEHQYPRLTAAQTATVAANLGLVGRHVMRIRKTGVDAEQLEDIYQDGVLGLMRAVQLWNPAKATLATYADRWIRKRIQQGRDRREFEETDAGFLKSLDAHVVLGRPGGYGRSGPGAHFGPAIGDLPRRDDTDVEADVLDHVDNETRARRVIAACRDDVDLAICAGLARGSSREHVAAVHGLTRDVVRGRVQRLRAVAA